ncbi:MAG: thiamine phosphate synthase [Acidobacteriota bacterium]
MHSSGGITGILSFTRRPVFYYITDRHQLPAQSIDALLDRIRRALSLGVDFVQLREKDLPDAELLALTRATVRFAGGTKCRIIVNGRIDIALAGRAHGVHLPSSGITSADLKPHLPRNFIMGVSAHSRPQAQRAAAGGADYILLGPIFPTPSKLKYGKPLGLRRFGRICGALTLPVLGLGGIRPDRIAEVLDAGAIGIAGISLFQDELNLAAHNSWLTGR